MNTVLSRISFIVNTTALGDAAKVEEIKYLLADAGVCHAPDVIARLLAIPKAQGGFDDVSPRFIRANYSSVIEPSLVGAELEMFYRKRVSQQFALESIRKKKRRPATVAETLFYGIRNPDALQKYWIYCLVETCVDGANLPYMVMISADDCKRYVSLQLVAAGIRQRKGRIVSFPM